MATSRSSGGIGTPALSSPGLGSGLDVAGLVQKLMQAESRPVAALDKQTAADQAKISAYGTLKGALGTLQGALSNLTSTSKLRTLAATVADKDVLAATVGSTATPGKYTIEVTDLAYAHKVASLPFASNTSGVGTGTLTFDFGTFANGAFTANGGGAKTVAIGAGKDSLAGIRDAVNAASIGVTAAIVNDGNSPGARLVFTSNATGAANSLKVTVADDDGNPTDAAGLSQLAFDPAAAAGAGRNMTEKVAAQDAQLVIDGIDVHSPSNQLANAIDGLTLNLAKTNKDSPTVLTVANDTNALAANVVAFIKAFNELHGTIGNLTKYDAGTKTASVLTGDATVRTLQNQLRSLLGGAIGTGAVRTLSQAGIAFQADGTLALDRSKLDAAIASSATGVMQLFASMGTATDSLASVTGFSAKTQGGTWALDVSQLATQGTLVGQAGAGLTITAGVNDSLTVGVDGVSATVTLGAGTYASAAALAAEVAAKINGASALSAAGAGVTATEAAGVLTIASNRYGSQSRVVASGNAAATLLGGSPAASTGVDLAGTLGGNPMSASGRTLVGVSGTPLEGLQVQVTGGALGPRGTITYQAGFASRLNDLLTGVLGTSGPVNTRTDGLQKDMKRISDRKEAINARLARVEKHYYDQFNALDQLLQGLSLQSSALAQQLATLPKINGG